MRRYILSLLLQGAAVIVPCLRARAGVDTPCVFVANSDADYVSVIDANALTSIANIQVQGLPRAIAMSPDGRFVYAVTTGHPPIPLADDITHTRLSIIDIAAGYRVRETIAVSECADTIVVERSGVLAYLGDYCGSGIDVVNLEEKSLVGRIPVGASLYGGNNPIRFALTADGRRLYVPLQTAPIGSIGVFETATGMRSSIISFLPALEVPGAHAVVLGPGDMTAYVLLRFGHAALPALNTVTQGVSDVLNGVGNAITVSPIGTELYVAGDHLRIIDLQSRDTMMVDLGSGEAEAVALTPDGSLVFVAQTGTDRVVAVDTRTRDVVAYVPVGRSPRDLAVGNVPGGCFPAGFTPEPTGTPTASPTPTPSKRPTPECPDDEPCLKIGSSAIRSGDTGRIGATLQSAGRMFTGMQNDLRLDSRLVLSGCELGSNLDASAAFRYDPPFRALVLSSGALPNGQIYSCDVSVSPGMPPGVYPLLLGSTIAADSMSNEVSLAEADGSVVVLAHSSSVLQSAGNGCQLAETQHWSAPIWVGVLSLLALLRRRPSRGISPKGVVHSSEVDVLLFAASDGTSGVELWRSDRSEAPPALVMDINPGALSAKNPAGWKSR